MASFSWSQCKIFMTNQAGSFSGTISDIQGIPTNQDATMSLVHEYSHFLQMISSLSGFRLFCELITFGVHGAVRFLGYGPSDIVSGYHEILPVLRNQNNNSGRIYPDIQERAQSLTDEAGILFSYDDYEYTGNKQPWEIDTFIVSNGTYQNEPFCGIVTPRIRIRPITPGMLAEGLSRRIDQLIKNNHGYNNHVWSSSFVEDEYYNGILNVISQERYSHNVLEQYRNEITAILCSLALATERPDKAMFFMLEKLALKVNAGIIPKTVGGILKDVLVKQGSLNANHYNKVMDHTLHGPATIMARSEFSNIYEQLKRIQKASNNVISDPLFFVDKTMNWDTIKIWMNDFSLPPIEAVDGSVSEIDGIQCESFITDYLSEVERVLL